MRAGTYSATIERGTMLGWWAQVTWHPRAEEGIALDGPLYWSLTRVGVERRARRHMERQRQRDQHQAEGYVIE